MAAYYNEIDKFAAQWLRELIKAGLIADGEVDERDIRDVQAADVRGFTQCHFFAGIGGWSYALRLAGWPDDRPVWTGSCPCQPFANCGEGAGFNDPRHLWPAWFRLIRQCAAPVILGEQVASKAGRGWLDHVATDLEWRDYAVGAADLPAASVGAAHVRQRLWWCAHANGVRREEPRDSGPYAGHYPSVSFGEADRILHVVRSNALPLLCREHDGVSASVGVMRGFGNAIVPQVAQAFIESYLEATER